MKYIKMVYVLFCLVQVGLWCEAQDMVYNTRNKGDNWKVTEIAPGYIKSIDVNNPQLSYSTGHSSVLFVFNDRGNFLVVPKLFGNPERSKTNIKYFMHYVTSAFHQADRVITLKNDIITCKIIAEVEEGVVYTISNKQFVIPKSEIALIIYKDGTHKLIAGINKVYRTLRVIQDDYYASNMLKTDTAGNRQNTSIGVTGSGKKGDTMVQVSSMNVGKVATTQKSAGEKYASINEPSNKPAGTDSQLVKPAVFRNIINNSGQTVLELDNTTLTSLQEKAILNIRELESYIKFISGKQSDPDQISRAIEQAVSLFASEDSRIQVSSINKVEPQEYKVRVYLNRLGLMKYNKVIIEWYNVQYASKVLKNPDGTYTGYIEFEQRFTGISGDKKVYQDITRKTIEMVIKRYSKSSAGETVVAWDAFLGNIGITVTKPQ